jgi:hypothetical protein
LRLPLIILSSVLISAPYEILNLSVTNQSVLFTSPLIGLVLACLFLSTLSQIFLWRLLNSAPIIFNTGLIKITVQFIALIILITLKTSVIFMAGLLPAFLFGALFFKGQISNFIIIIILILPGLILALRFLLSRILAGPILVLEKTSIISSLELATLRTHGKIFTFIKKIFPWFGAYLFLAGLFYFFNNYPALLLLGAADFCLSLGLFKCQQAFK